MTDFEIKKSANRITDILSVYPRSRIAETELSTLRHTLATEYGCRNGWKYVHPGLGTAFNLKALRENKLWAYSRHEGGGLNSRFMDHPYYYRSQDGKAVAIIAHTYNLPDVKNDAERWALSEGLTASFPDFVSWYNPQATTIIQYTSACLEVVSIQTTEQLQQYIASDMLCRVKISNRILFSSFELADALEKKQSVLKHWRAA
jgi:hypothetical protein